MSSERRACPTSATAAARLSSLDSRLSGSLVTPSWYDCKSIMTLPKRRAPAPVQPTGCAGRVLANAECVVQVLPAAQTPGHFDSIVAYAHELLSRTVAREIPHRLSIFHRLPDRTCCTRDTALRNSGYVHMLLPSRCHRYFLNGHSHV